MGRRRSTRETIMPRVTLVRYTAKPERAPENEILSKAVFAELTAAAPDHIAYALFRDGPEFLHLFVNLKGDDSSPVTELPTFKAFSRDIAERCEASPQTTRLSLPLVASYGFPTAPSAAEEGRRATVA